MIIKELRFEKYKKLESIDVNFSHGINAIFGTNSTCKTSILHIIGNSYQEVSYGSEQLTDKKSLKIIKKINLVTNPKIEQLNRGDAKFNDPAPNHVGNLYTCVYDDREIAFRKHNSKEQNRYRVIPKYPKGKKESLPNACVIYLGLSRLSSYGEFLSNEQISEISGTFSKLPLEYQKDILRTYKIFTRYEIDNIDFEEIQGVKKRARFLTKTDGTDSNTVSAGEDNLMIILTAVFSLKYFCSSQVAGANIPAILLIDEFDATLHPEYQIKLLNLLKEHCKLNPNFHIYFTSHSISLLEECTNQKLKTIYLINDVFRVKLLENPTPINANAYLQNKLNREIYRSRSIPVLLEDSEAKLFFKELINYFSLSNSRNLVCGQLQHLYPVEGTTFSSETIKSMFKNPNISFAMLPFIGCVDGDCSDTDLGNSLIKLPGNACPEELLFEYLETVANTVETNDQLDLFWKESEKHGFTRVYILSNILPEIKDIDKSIEILKTEGKSTKGLKREKYKKLFNNYSILFSLLIKLWINDVNNDLEVRKFYENLIITARQNARYNNLDPDDFTTSV